jgi:hypothetical protein
VFIVGADGQPGYQVTAFVDAARFRGHEASGSARHATCEVVLVGRGHGRNDRPGFAVPERATYGVERPRRVHAPWGCLPSPCGSVLPGSQHRTTNKEQLWK